MSDFSYAFAKTSNTIAGGIAMKEDEKKPISWEIKDPKPPVIRSGRMEDRRFNA